MIWNETTIAELKRLWSEGHSTAEIGRRLGCSKNAIVGKSHRLELDARPDPINRPTRPHPKKAAIETLLRQGISPQRVANRLRVGTKIVSKIRDAAGIPLVRPECRPIRAPKAVTIPRLPSEERPMLVQDVRQTPLNVPKPRVVPFPIAGTRACQFIEGHGRPWTMCGLPVAHLGCSWCATHRKRVFQPMRAGVGEAAD